MQQQFPTFYLLRVLKPFIEMYSKTKMRKERKAPALFTKSFGKWFAQPILKPEYDPQALASTVSPTPPSAPSSSTPGPASTPPRPGTSSTRPVLSFPTSGSTRRRGRRRSTVVLTGGGGSTQRLTCEFIGQSTSPLLDITEGTGHLILNSCLIKIIFRFEIFFDNFIK